MNSPDYELMEIDRDKPLQVQIHQHLVEWICAGRLAPGSRLLSSRQLAEQLQVSRNTVMLVIEQLKSEGFLTGIVGKGVFVSEKLPSHVESLSLGFRDDFVSSVGQSLPRISKFAKSLDDTQAKLTPNLFAFQTGVPDLTAFPYKTWMSLYRRHYDRALLSGYIGHQGYGPLREALAQYLNISRGLRCDASQIIITNGAQEALSLCARVVLNAGDTVLFENPGYRSARRAFLSYGLKIKPVPLRKDVINVDRLPVQKNRSNLLYVTPTHQYPMGGVLSAGDRLRLISWAIENKSWVLEDDYDSEYAFAQRPVAALQGLAARTPVLYVGSFSKTLLPALRMGYLVVPKPLVRKFVLVKSYFSGEVCAVNQAIVADFILEGHFVRHLRRMRRLYKAKWTHFVEVLQWSLPKQARLIGYSAGMHLVVEMPGVDDRKILNQMNESGFGGECLSACYSNKATKRGMILGFANTTELQRESCANYLSELLEKEYGA